MSPLKCPIGKNTKQIMPNLYNLQFTDTELDTIAAALDDYMAYADDEFASQDDLIGGLPVADRINSINDKIDEAFKNQRIGYPNSRANN